MDGGSLSASSSSSSEQEADSSPYSVSALLQNPEGNGAIEESRYACPKHHHSVDD